MNDLDEEKKKKEELSNELLMSSDCKRTHTKIEGEAQKSRRCIEECHKLLRMSEESKARSVLRFQRLGEAKDK